MVYLPKAVDDERLATAKGFNADTDTDSSDSESDEEKLEQYVPTTTTRHPPPKPPPTPIPPRGWVDEGRVDPAACRMCWDAVGALSHTHARARASD